MEARTRYTAGTQLLETMLCPGRGPGSAKGEGGWRREGYGVRSRGRGSGRRGEKRRMMLTMLLEKQPAVEVGRWGTSLFRSCRVLISALFLGRARGRCCSRSCLLVFFSPASSGFYFYFPVLVFYALSFSNTLICPCCSGLGRANCLTAFILAWALLPIVAPQISLVISYLNKQSTCHCAILQRLRACGYQRQAQCLSDVSDRLLPEYFGRTETERPIYCQDSYALSRKEVGACSFLFASVSFPYHPRLPFTALMCILHEGLFPTSFLSFSSLQ